MRLEQKIYKSSKMQIFILLILLMIADVKTQTTEYLSPKLVDSCNNALSKLQTPLSPWYATKYQNLNTNSQTTTPQQIATQIIVQKDPKNCYAGLFGVCLIQKTTLTLPIGSYSFKFKLFMEQKSNKDPLPNSVITGNIFGSPSLKTSLLTGWQTFPWTTKSL